MDSKFLRFVYGLYKSSPEMFEQEISQTDDTPTQDNLQKSESNTISIVKQFDEEELIALEPLYINVGGVDAHGDGISEEHLDMLIDNFNKNIDNIQGNIHHSFMTQGFKPIKAYRMPVTVYVGDPSKPHEMVMIEEGMPVVKIQYAKNVLGRKYWEMRKQGKLGAPSIGATGKRVPNPDYVEVSKGTNGYISVKLHKEDAKVVNSWLSDIGVEGGIGVDELHSTLFFSKKGMDKIATDPTKEFEATLKGIEFMGDKSSKWGAIAATLVSSDLENRFETIKSLGNGEHSYPDFKPHLSLKYSPTEEDIEKVKNSVFPLNTLRFYEERQEDINI